MLLVGASLMIRTLLAVQSTDLGVRTDRLLTMRIPLNEKTYSDLTRRDSFFQQLLERLEATPGVAAAAINTSVHRFGNWRRPGEVAGNAQQDQRPVMLHQVSEDYIRVMGIPLIRGRLFTEDEVLGRQALALVNQTFVTRYFAGRDPLGRTVRIPALRTTPFNTAADSLQIVGVVRDTLDWFAGGEITPEIYIPFTLSERANRLIAHAQGDPAYLASQIRKQA